MNEKMKVMIAYDGSAHADAAIEDLRRAGLPRDAEALVVSAVNEPEIKPAFSEFDLFSLASGRAGAVLSSARIQREKAIEETEDLAAEAAKRVRGQFPSWKVESKALVGDPADELLKKAVEWKPDLIVVGSHGRSAIERFFLGSVSKRITEEANASVRIARRGFEKTDDEPVKIIAAASNLKDAELIIETIGRRVWSNGTKVLLVAVDDGVSADGNAAAHSDAAGIFEKYAESLAAFGIEVSVDVKSGDSQTVLLETADAWQADSIFVAAPRETDGSTVLDKTTKKLITNAKCTVEIVRN